MLQKQADELMASSWISFTYSKDLLNVYEDEPVKLKNTFRDLPKQFWCPVDGTKNSIF